MASIGRTVRLLSAAVLLVIGGTGARSGDGVTIAESEVHTLPTLVRMIRATAGPRFFVDPSAVDSNVYISKGTYRPDELVRLVVRATGLELEEKGDTLWLKTPRSPDERTRREMLAVWQQLGESVSLPAAEKWGVPQFDATFWVGHAGRRLRIGDLKPHHQKLVDHWLFRWKQQEERDAAYAAGQQWRRKRYTPDAGGVSGLMNAEVIVVPSLVIGVRNWRKDHAEGDIVHYNRGGGVGAHLRFHEED